MLQCGLRDICKRITQTKFKSFQWVRFDGGSCSYRRHRLEADMYTSAALMHGDSSAYVYQLAPSILAPRSWPMELGSVRSLFAEYIRRSVVFFAAGDFDLQCSSWP